MKKCLMALFVAAAATVSQASYLYWQVDQSDLDTANIGGNWANLYVMDTSGTVEDKWLDKAQIGQQSSVDVSSYEQGSYSFYVEIVNYSDSAAPVTGGSSASPTSYANLVASKAIVGTAMSVPNVAAWHGGAVAAPEPTSGFLMMVGLALLGLKRRKV